jgi:hypothetical protein
MKAQEKICIADENKGHFQNGWIETEFEPTKSFIQKNQLSGSENTIWEKGDEYAIGTKDTWGNQVGVAFIFHKSKVD